MFTSTPPLGLVISALLVAWFLATAAAQLRGTVVAIRLRRLDPLSLLPSWSFFAPNPGTRDHHLVYRVRLADGGLGRWKEIHLGGTRRPWHFLWNPHMRQGKVLSDAVGALNRASRSMAPVGYKTTLPYLVLLSHVEGVAGPLAETVQFAILDSWSHQNTEPKVAFLSEFHRRSAHARS